ncbi:MAG: glycosyltransferase family 2 protein [Pseudomonadota bacterium]
MKMSVVIVNWNGADLLEACLDSLFDQDLTGLEVIVVDNASTDVSRKMLAERFPQVVVIALSENLGFPEACNIGIDKSDSDWVILLNNDTRVAPNWVAEMRKAAEQAPAQCGMLQAVMVYMDRPEILNSAGILLSRIGAGCDIGDGIPASSFTLPEKVFCATAGAAAYRRTMLTSLRLPSGYLDRRHFLYFEDMDLGWRARLAGWSTLVVPNARVRHVWHGTNERYDESWLGRLTHRNHWRTLIKNASVVTLLRTAPGMAATTLRHMRAGGRKSLEDTLQAMRESWATRQEVEALRTHSRREVERAWMER